jgi:hypothetical protein
VRLDAVQLHDDLTATVAVLTLHLEAVDEVAEGVDGFDLCAPDGAPTLGARGDVTPG